MPDNSLAADVATLQHARIFFGHQSVGNNLLNGIARLYMSLPGQSAFLPFRDTSGYPEDYFAAERIGENTKPASKCAGFAHALARFTEHAPEIAMMKFCYVDFGTGMSAKEIFALYVSTIDSLKRLYPQITFVHMTAPLTAPRSGMKELVRKLIGRGEKFESDNIERNTFNQLLTTHYAGEPIFDLATVESTRPDGKRETFDADGAQIFTLVPDYTTDGGHLNETGQLIAAREMVHTLAAAIRKSRPVSSPLIAPR
jgi:hypothetical protein